MTPKHKNAWVSILKVTAVLNQKMDSKLRTAGEISIDYYDVLLALEDAPNGKMTMSELSSSVLVSPSGVTRLIDRMAKEGYVNRQSNAKDRRSKFACITTLGLDARKSAWPILKLSMEELWVAHMTEAEAATILDIMKRMVSPKEYE